MAIIFTKLPVASIEKGVPGGVATLDPVTGYIPLSQIDPSIGGQGDVLSVNNIDPDNQGNVDITTTDIPEGNQLYYNRDRFDEAFIDSINPYATDVDITNEANARIAGDGFLQNNINNEVLARQGADTTLQGNIDTVSSNLAQEILDRQGADNTLQDQIDTLDSGLAQEILDRQGADTTLQGNIDTVSSGLAQEILDRQGADTTLQSNIDDEESRAMGVEDDLLSLIHATNNGVGLNQSTGVYTPPGGSQFLGSSTSVLSALSALDTNLATVYNDFDIHHLHSNSFYVNSSNDIQTVHDLVGFGQGAVMYVASGSYGGADLSLTKQNFAIQAPYVGVGTTICELSGGRGVNISGVTCTRVRISNLQIEGNFTINNTEGRHVFTNTEFLGTTTITNGTSNFLVFTDCAFVGQVSIASTVTATIYFVRCSFNGVLINSLVASPLQVILTDASGLNASQSNLTSNVVLVGRNGYANNSVVNYQSASNYVYDLINGLSTTFTGAYSELRGKPTLVTASTGLSDSASLVRTSDIGTTVAPLTAGKVPLEYIPATVLTDVHVVADETERLAIPDLVEGDYAIQTDDGSQWIYSGTTWYQVSSSTAGISTVNGKTGASITLVTDDISEDGTPTNLWFTDTRARTASVVDSTDNSETNQAPSVSSIKSYISNQLSSKLDSSSYTASDVFAKVLTQDGTGSGLDADLLDGINSDAFVQTTGTQSIAGVKTFTDAPIVPDQSALDNSTKVANTKYVDSAIQVITDIQGTSGQVLVKGSYNPTTNTPVLTSAKKGYLYSISANGTLAGVSLTTTDQILFVNDVAGGVVQATDFTVIDNTESGLTNGTMGIINLIADNSVMTSGFYHLMTSTGNWTIKVPSFANTKVGDVIYLRIRGTGTFNINRTDTGYTATFYYNNTSSTNALSSLKSTGEYIFRCTAKNTSANTLTWEVVNTNPVALRTTDDLTEGTTNKYASATNVRPLLSATAPIVYTSSTGVISTTLTQYTDALARSASGVGLVNGDNTGITFVNDTGNSRINATVSLAGFSINALSDVDTVSSAPTNGQSLVWNSSSSQWTPQTVSGGGGGGGITFADTINTNNAILTASASNTMYLIDNSSTAFNIYLPQISTCNGFRLLIKRLGTGLVTINRNALDTSVNIDYSGQTSVAMGAQYACFELVGNSTTNTWYLV
jgi:hypothetical protein